MAKVSSQTVRHIGCVIAACGSLTGCFDPLIEDPGAAGHGNQTPGIPGVDVPAQPGMTNPGAVEPPGGVQPGNPNVTPPVTTGSTVTPTPGVPTGAAPTDPSGASGGSGQTGASGSTGFHDEPSADSGGIAVDTESGDAGVLDGSVGSALKHDPTSSEVGPTGSR